jgi:hypothetical protein
VAGSDSAGTQLHLEVDLGSLDTGVGMRNRHMRDDYLEVKRYPYAIYTGVIQSVRATGPGAFRVTAAGTMMIHGVKKPMEVPCDVLEAGTGYRAHCALHVQLSDFDIEIPRLMFLKLSNDIGLDVAFTVKPSAAPPPLHDGHPLRTRIEPVRPLDHRPQDPVEQLVVGAVLEAQVQ